MAPPRGLHYSQTKVRHPSPARPRRPGRSIALDQRGPYPKLEGIEDHGTPFLHATPIPAR